MTLHGNFERIKIFKSRECKVLGGIYNITLNIWRSVRNKTYIIGESMNSKSDSCTNF